MNSILFNCESFNYLNRQQIESLEAADAEYFRICFQSHSKTARDAYYAETGKHKIRHILAKRRFMFLKNILNRPGQLINKIYKCQLLRPVKNDFCLTIQSDKQYYNIELDDDEIMIMSKRSFKSYLERKINFKVLEEFKEGQSGKID